MKDLQSSLLDLVKKGDVKKVKKLLEKDFSREILTYSGENALHIASKSDNIEMVEILLNDGFEVNSKTFSGKTPLIFAAENGRFKICKLLIERGADVSLKTDLGEGALGNARFSLKHEMDLHNEDPNYANEEEMKNLLYNYYFTIRLLKNEMQRKQIKIENQNELFI